MAEPTELHEQLVDAANAIYGSHPRARAFHAKGFYCEGVFEATAEAGELSRAAHLQGEEIPALVRFSLGGGDPEGHDSVREPRGIAIKLTLPGGEQTDILCVTTPVFATRTPEDFLELLRVRRPDPETGQPDLAAVGAFLEAHPESLPAVQATLGTPPPASYAQLAYHSQHAFGLVDGDGATTWVRYRIEPRAGEATLDDEEASARERDYMRAELEERLRSGPVTFDLVFVVGEEGDPIDDPTAAWPEGRRRVGAATLEVRRLVDDPETDGEVVVFDPIRIVDGIQLPDDPILHARSPAYSVSVSRRMS
jgi:catalase